MFGACIQHVLLIGYDTDKVAPHIWQRLICELFHFGATFQAVQLIWSSMEIMIVLYHLHFTNTPFSHPAYLSKFSFSMHRALSFELQTYIYQRYSVHKKCIYYTWYNHFIYTYGVKQKQRTWRHLRLGCATIHLNHWAGGDDFDPDKETVCSEYVQATTCT